MVKRSKYRKNGRRKTKGFRSKRKMKLGVVVKTKGVGIPDRMMVKLPYTFNYQVNAASPGSILDGQTVLGLFAGNSYPNVGGGTVPGSGARIEVPSQFYNYSTVYGRAVITGALLDCTVTFDGAFGPTVTPNSSISNVLFSAATVTSTCAAYDTGSAGAPDDSGDFFWNGVVSGAARPSSVSASGNWSRLLTLNVEELMSTPDTTIKKLSGPFGSKTQARIRQYMPTGRLISVKDIMDNQELSFSPPQNTGSPLDNESFPQRGFGWIIKGFSPNLGTGGGTGINWQVSGRITYYVTFFQKLSAEQQDWFPN